jgi:hypothetical protein
LFAKLRPEANDVSRSAGSSTMSVPTARPLLTAKRSASAPKRRTTSSGSMPLPSDFDIFTCLVSRTVPCRYTVWNGTRPMKCRPAMIIRATQKKMISGAVTRTSVG